MENQTNIDQDEEGGGSCRRNTKGGFITMPFILGNEALERVASSGLTPNMIVYLMEGYKLSASQAQNLLYFLTTLNCFTPFIGGILADSLFGRFLTIAFGSIFTSLGMLVIWLTTVIPQAKPPPCDLSTSNCPSPTTGQFAFLILGFFLMAIGGGGTRPCSQAFGVDQVTQGNNIKHNNRLEIFLNWYYMFSCVSVIIALTVIVYIQDRFGWSIGFGVPVALMFLATLFFLLASPFYYVVKGNKNLLVNLVQVGFAALKKRNMNVVDGVGECYYHGSDSDESVPSDKLRFLNKACIIQDPSKDIGPDGLPTNPWSLTRLEDVETLKAFIRIIPIWSTSIMMCINTSTAPFALLLTRTMDRHIGPSNFEIPAASFGTFTVLVVGIWIPLYDRILLPLASKIRGKPVKLSAKLRIGLSLFIYFISMLTSGIVETIRRQRVLQSGVHMSAMWTLPTLVFSGIADAFYGIGQMEFIFTELPNNMLSIAVAIFGLLGMFGSLIASLILNLVDGFTKTDEKEGWIADDVNKGHYDYFYYLLAVLNLVNVLYYVYCSWVYGPSKTERMSEEVIDDDEKTPLLRQ